MNLKDFQADFTRLIVLKKDNEDSKWDLPFLPGSMGVFEEGARFLHLGSDAE